MSKITVEAIKELRSRTGVGINHVKEALEEANGDIDKAVIYLRQKGIAKATKRSANATNYGVIGHYIHGNNIAVLVELLSETDFAGRSEEFKTLAKELALHIAAKSPEYINIESVPANILDTEKEVYSKELAGKAEGVANKILEGKLAKFYEENVLLEQLYIRDESKKIKDLLNDTIATLGENIKINRFVKINLGGSVTLSELNL